MNTLNGDCGTLYCKSMILVIQDHVLSGARFSPKIKSFSSLTLGMNNINI